MKYYKFDREDNFIKNNKNYIKNIYSIKIDNRYLISNIGKILSDNILDIITSIDEYNLLIKDISNVILSIISRYILMFGFNLNKTYISDIIINELYTYMDKTSQLSLLNTDIIEDKEYIHKFINVIFNKLRDDFKDMSNRNINDIEDAFTVLYENYSDFDFCFYKVTERNEIIILEIK